MPQDETGRTPSAPVATGRDGRYSLSIEAAGDCYARAGHPRTLRSIQRYCANGHLDSIKVQTSLGDKYFIDPVSLERHVAQINELALLDSGASGRDMSRHVAPSSAAQLMGDTPRPTPTAADVSPPVASYSAEASVKTVQDTQRQLPQTEIAMSPPVADVMTSAPHTGADGTQQPVAMSELAVSPSVASEPSPAGDIPTDTSRQVATEDVDHFKKAIAQKDEEIGFLREQSRDEREFLREQIDRKDRTIEALIERDRETNFLIRGLQDFMRPMLGSRHEPRADEPPGSLADQRVDN